MEVFWTVLQVLGLLVFVVVYVIITSPNVIADVICRVVKLIYNLYRPLFTRPGETFEIPESTFKIEEDKNDSQNP